jgi:hypothetical protein
VSVLELLVVRAFVSLWIATQDEVFAVGAAIPEAATSRLGRT